MENAEDETVANENDLEAIARVFGEWKENIQNGTWEFKTEEIEIHVSFWRHLDMNTSYMAAIRWEYLMKNYATYIKIFDDNKDVEKLLLHASGFVTNWLAEQKEAVAKEDEKKEEPAE